MASEQLYEGIVAVQTVGMEQATADLIRFTQTLSQQASQMGAIGSSATFGDGLAQDLLKAENAAERLLRVQNELRTGLQSRASDPGVAEQLRALDALILKTEQLRRLQALPPPTDTSNTAQLARAQAQADIAREDARLRGGGGVYGDGLAGMRRENQVNAADARVGKVDERLSKAQADLARVMQEGLAAREAEEAAAERLAAAERNLAESTARRDASIADRQALAARGLNIVNPDQPKAADQLAVNAAERERVAAMEGLNAATFASADAETRILEAKNRIVGMEGERARRSDEARLTRAENISRASGDEGVRVNYDDVLADARSRVAQSYEEILAAQLGVTKAEARHEQALNRKYKDDTAGFAAQAATGEALERAQKRLADAFSAHANAEAAAANPASKVNYDDVLARARAVEPGSYSKLEQAQLNVVRAEENLALAKEEAYANERRGIARQAGAGSAVHAAQEQLARATKAHAEAEAEAASAAEREAERRRVAGSAQRDALLNPDSQAFLAATGADTTGSIRMQELQIEQRKLAQSKEQLLARAAAVDSEQDLAKLIEQRQQLEKRILANTQAQTRARYLETGRGGFVGGLIGNFDGSPQGVSRADIGFQAGQAAKFYALYTAMSAVQGSIGALITLSAEYSLAVSDLAVAMNTSTAAAEEAAKSYVEIGAELGAGPIEALQGAAKFRRTFRDPDTQQSVPGAGEEGARAASYMYVLEGPERIEKVMQDLIAVMGAYDRGPEGTMGVYDQTQFISQQYGFSAGEVLGGSAALADLGKERGYDLAELTALIASVMQATGTTSDAVGGDVKRILASADSDEFNATFEKWGVSLDQNFQQRMLQLAEIFQGLPEEQRAREVTAMANDPRTGASFAAMLNAAVGADRIVQGSEGGAAGYVDKQAKQRLDALGGELMKLRTSLYQAAVAVGDIGIVQVLETLVHALSNAAGMVTVLADAVALVPDWAKEAVTWLVALAVAAKATTATRAAFEGNSVLSGIAPGAGGRTRRNEMQILQGQQAAALAVGNTNLAATYAAQIRAAEQASTGVARLTTGVRSFGAAAMSAAGPLAITAAIMAGMTIAGDAKKQRDDREAIERDTVKREKVLGGSITDRDSYASAIAAQRKAAEDLIKTDDGVSGRFTDWRTGLATISGGAFLVGALTGTGDDAAEALEARAKAIREKAEQADKALAEYDAQVKATETSSKPEEYFGQDGHLLTYRINQLKLRGASPEQSMERLQQAVRNLDPQQLLQPVEGEEGVETLVKNTIDRIQQSTDPVGRQGQFGQLRGILSELRSRTSTPEQDAALRQLIEQANSLYLEQLSANTEAKIANIKAMQGKGNGPLNQIRALITNALDEATGAADVEAIVGLLNQVDKAFLDSYRKGMEAQLAILKQQQAALASAAGMAAADLARVAAAVGNPFGAAGPDPASEAKKAIDEQVAEQERRIAAFESAAGQTTVTGSAFKWPDGKEKDKPEDVEAARLASLAKPNDALQSAQADLDLAQYRYDQAEKGTVAYYDALKALNDAKHAFARAELDRAVSILQLDARPGDALSQANVAVRVAKAQLDAEAKDTTEYNVALAAYRQAQFDSAQAAVAAETARIGASAISGDSYSQAVAAVKIAQAELNATVGKTEYWTALKGLRDAQYELGQQELERVNNARLLAGDVTDPVAQARAELQAAKDKLAFDQKRGASSATITADQLAVKEAQAQAASTAWSQQFGDMQTNYDLNRISLSAYLKYLNSQKAYLEAVKNKTRDQVEQLNQVDQALKSLADGLQGQWNLGDIRMPTPYEVRSAMAGNQAALTTNNITINGADTNAVIDLLTRLLGVSTIGAAATTPAKV